jgi:Carboxypeptidase regulatory-like domain
MSRWLAGLTVLTLAPCVCVHDLRARGQTPAGQGRPAPATAIIRGRVVAADTGRPLRFAQLGLTAPELGNQTRAASTDFDGRYEFNRLPAGRYSLVVDRRGYLSLRYGQRRPLEQGTPLQLLERQVLERVDFALPKMSVIAGRVTDESGDPMAGVTVVALRSTYVEGRRRLVMASRAAFVRTDDEGRYRLSGLPPGAYFVVGTTQETWTSTAGGRRQVMGFAPTYFPGTVAAGGAARITVGMAARLTGRDLSMVPARTATVSGVVRDSHGRWLAGEDLQLTEQFGSPDGGGESLARFVLVGADGTFSIPDVPPGEYKLSAQTPADPGGRREVGSLAVVVNGADVENLAVTTSAGWSATGRISMDNGAAPPGSFRRINISGRPSNPTLNSDNPAEGQGQVNADWSFFVSSIHGPARFRVDLPDGWMVKAVLHDGRDITETPVEMRSGEELSGVQVVVTDRAGAVTGQLVDSRGGPSLNGTVIVFASDRNKWSADSPYVRAARPDQQGQYRIGGLPPGEYVAVALDSVEEGVWNDPEYLESIRQYGRRVTLTDRESQTVPLSVAP